MSHGTRKTVALNRIPPAFLHKWPGALLDEGFVPVAKRFLRSIARIWDGGDIREMIVLLTLVDHLRPDFERLISVSRIGWVAGLTNEQVVEAVLGLTRRDVLGATFLGDDVVRFDLSPLYDKVEEFTPGEA